MIPLDTVKTWLGVTSAAYDAPLTELAARTLATIERALDWYFGPPRQVREILEAFTHDRLWIRQPPEDGLVTLESRTWLSTGWTVISGADYELVGRTIYALNYPGFYLGGRAYRATYNEGFAAVPGDILQLALDLISARVSVDAGGLKKSESIGDYSYDIGEADLATSREWPTIQNTYKRGRI